MHAAPSENRSNLGVNLFVCHGVKASRVRRAPMQYAVRVIALLTIPSHK
jgi:hypothetical protein